MTDHLPSPAAPSRRTLVKTAAWTAPVVVTAAAAPSMAASTECPTAAPGAQWGVISPAAGSFSASGTNAWLGDWDGKGNTWLVQKDNGSASTSQGATAVAYTNTTIPVVAGTTYTFTFEVSGIWSTVDPTPPSRVRGRQFVRILFDGADQLRLATRPDVDGGQQIPMGVGGSMTWATYSFTYTATQTKDVELGFWNQLSPRDVYNTNDDIFLTRPTITCS